MHYLPKRWVTRRLTREHQVLDPDLWEYPPLGDPDPRITYMVGIPMDQLAGTRGSW
jgi:hypothetical protein